MREDYKSGIGNPFRSFGTLDDALNWVREKLRDVGA